MRRRYVSPAQIPNAADIKLPDGIVENDLVYPKYDDADKIVRSAGDYGEFTLYYTTAFGWCVATLGISKGTRGRSDRTYASRLSDGAGCRIGNGPHVLKTVTVYARESRMEALKFLIDRHHVGAVNAGETRDRISSRRAQGSLMRAQGRTSWRWDV